MNAHPALSRHAALIVLISALVVLLPIATGADRDAPDYLSSFEAAVVNEINAARTNPRRYSWHLERWLRYYDGRLREIPGRPPVMTHEGEDAVREAIAFLRKADRVRKLEPSAGMSLAARDHVEDMGPPGAMGHTGYDESNVGERVDRYGEWRVKVAENIAYGSDPPRDLVMRLIIDDGVPGRGHRTNLFDPDFRFVGVSYGPHKRYDAMCVITLAGEYEE